MTPVDRVATPIRRAWPTVATCRCAGRAGSPDCTATDPPVAELVLLARSLVADNAAALTRMDAYIPTPPSERTDSR